MSPILSLLIFIPLLGVGVLYALPSCHPGTVGSATSLRLVAFVFTVLAFVLSLLAWGSLDVENPSFQLVELIPWIESYGVSYSLGVDGISILLVVLTTFLMPLVVLSSRSITKHLRGYLASMLVLETAMLGTLLSLDLFLFYIFWELMLAPMYFIIGIWGGERRVYATLKFVLYTVAGSLLMLVAVLYLVMAHYSQASEITFALDALTATQLTFVEELWLFGAFALAFGIKVPLFPFHTWLPDAHVEAPTGGSVILAGVLLKMGLYGFIRFGYPLFPRAAEAFAPWIAGLAVIGVIYGALVAWAQVDIKKLVAYSSVSHLGYCVLGFVAFTTVSATGSIYQMLNHGISTGALFLMVGVLYDRTHSRQIADYGGLARQVPVYAFFLMIFTLSSIALPLTNGFVGEFMILLGSFGPFPWLTGVAVLGVILGAVYMLTLYLKVIFGELDHKRHVKLTDVNGFEMASLVPLAVLVFVMGVYPKPFLDTLTPTVERYIAVVDERREIRERLEDMLNGSSEEPEPSYFAFANPRPGLRAGRLVD